MALSLALGGGEEFAGRATQLGINLAGILVAATATLALQRAVWHRVPRCLPDMAGSSGGAAPVGPPGRSRPPQRRTIRR